MTIVKPHVYKSFLVPRLSLKKSKVTFTKKELTFSTELREKFMQMGVRESDLIDYEENFLNRFPCDTDKLTDLVKFLFQAPIPCDDRPQNLFNQYMERSPHVNSELEDSLYDLSQVIYVYRSKGKLEAYRLPDPQWFVPRITITKADDVLLPPDSLAEPITIYRGMSCSELHSKKYGQSWTLDPKIAENFAFSCYSDLKNPRMVAKAKIKINGIIHWDPNGSEKEVIVCPNELYDVEAIKKSQ